MMRSKAWASPRPATSAPRFTSTGGCPAGGTPSPSTSQTGVRAACGGSVPAARQRRRWGRNSRSAKVHSARSSCVSRGRRCPHQHARALAGRPCAAAGRRSPVRRPRCCGTRRVRPRPCHRAVCAQPARPIRTKCVSSATGRPGAALGQRPTSRPCRRCPGAPRGTCAGVALQELGRGDGATGAAAHIAHVREVALQRFVVFLVQRQAPGRVGGAVTGALQFGCQFVAGAEQARSVVAQRDHAGPGQRGDVDHRRGLEALGIGQRVAQDQPAFGVGVQDLDGLAGQAGDHVARLHRACRPACSRRRGSGRPR